MAPALVTSTMFRRWISLKGVSRTESTSLRRSFRHTSAARVTRSSHTPALMAASVRTEHGATIMPSTRYEPLAIGAARSCEL
ncbi:hypothetical protein ColKHC_12919 [Colletotrichum higginsianum]|nr:hypothetical protein ColKHC_12919 [Colletotrichum higginsianum]